MTAIRRYAPADLPAILTLFRETVHAVNARDYSPEQINAWAPRELDADGWAARLRSREAWVAEDGDLIVGFADWEADGHLDHLYCHKDRQRQGLGTRLLAAVEDSARARQITRLFTEASVTALPFFTRRGFRILREQTVIRRGVALVNYPMEKELRP